VLLDFHLNRLGILPDKIQGYDQEEYTHLAVAAAVSSGRADCGLASWRRPARWISISSPFSRSYQLVIPTQFYESELLRPLLDLMQNQEFR
jgi:putative molybdopterin biosynthesis protein